MGLRDFYAFLKESLAKKFKNAFAQDILHKRLAASVLGAPTPRTEKCVHTDIFIFTVGRIASLAPEKVELEQCVCALPIDRREQSDAPFGDDLLG